MKTKNEKMETIKEEIKKWNVSSRGFSIHPEEGKFNKCLGCYWEEISGNCMQQVERKIGTNYQNVVE